MEPDGISLPADWSWIDDFLAAQNEDLFHPTSNTASNNGESFANGPIVEGDYQYASHGIMSDDSSGLFVTNTENPFHNVLLEDASLAAGNRSTNYEAQDISLLR